MIDQKLLGRLVEVNMKDTIGRWRIGSLFIEFENDNFEAIFNLKFHDTKGKDGRKIYSLHKIYMSFTDPTEYKFATTILGGWKHWLALKKSSILGARLDFQDWADELDVKLASDAIEAMINTAMNEGSKGTTAAKYVAEAKWRKDVKPVGAPSRKPRVANKIDDEVEADVERMKLTLVK